MMGKNLHTLFGEVEEGVSPTLKYFIRKLNILFYLLSSCSFNFDQIKLSPLVCEIESDLQNVIEKFASGNEEYFLSKVQNNAISSGNHLRQLYSYLNIQEGTFYSAIPILSEIQTKVKDLVDLKFTNSGMPESFLENLKFVTENRSSMFENLYGAYTLGDKYEIAKRQMVNYLSVTLALSYTYPDGCLVLNTNTPNRLYVKNHQILKEFFNLDERVNLPTFYFL